MAEEKRLIGNDGKLVRGDLAATTVTTFAAGKWYKIAAKAAASSKFGDLAVGEFYTTPIEVVGTSGDEGYLLTETDLLDLSGWSLELNATEIAVTVLNDKYKKYRKGKADANGNAKFVFIKGITDIANGLANYFMDEVSINASGVVTKAAKITSSLYLVGYLDDTTVAGEIKSVTILNVELFKFSLPMDDDAAVNMDVPFRLSGDLDPILYRVTNV